ncbi:ribosomal protein L30 [Phlyctema vagabunda]|uniref:Large ribosomal subunit protein uL30m n=1 Tax=Phlyctema vagabunda TaxID=108571 RepID=A0ABR4PUZ2_9HELO
MSPTSLSEKRRCDVGAWLAGVYGGVGGGGGGDGLEPPVGMSGVLEVDAQRPLVSNGQNSRDVPGNFSLVDDKHSESDLGIGLPKRTQGVLKALGLRKRMKTVFYPVTPEVAGQIMKVKELVAVREVEKAMTKEELKDERRPEAGYYIESAVPR